VLEDKTSLIPDRLGNNRADTIGNLLARPSIGLIFFVPSIDETLCVNGRARVTTEATLLEPLTVNGKKPRSGILVTAEEIYFHCGKALMRSDLWNSDKHLRRSEFPSLGRILADQIDGISVEESERLTAESYKTQLYWRKPQPVTPRSASPVAGGAWRRALRAAVLSHPESC
jgi:uncharacterized protein